MSEKTYLFVGGSAHGEMRAVMLDNPTERVFLPTPVDLSSPNYEVPMPQTYYRRDMEMRTKGRVFRRTAYVHEDIRNPQVAQVALSDALLQRWVADGDEVIPGEVVDGG